MLKALFVPVLVTTFGLFFGVAGCTDNSGNGKYSNDSGATLDGAAGSDGAASEQPAGGSDGASDGGEVAPTGRWRRGTEAAADTPTTDGAAGDTRVETGCRLMVSATSAWTRPAAENFGGGTRCYSRMGAPFVLGAFGPLVAAEAVRSAQLPASVVARADGLGLRGRDLDRR